jgi:hypothetical protein
MSRARGSIFGGFSERVSPAQSTITTQATAFG